MVTSTVEKVDETKVKLSVTVPGDEVAKAIDAAAMRLSKSVKIPGFRPGRKVPLKVLESRLGRGAVREEAVRESVPGFYSAALAEHELVPVGQPSFDIDTFEPGADGEFTATFDVRPEFELPEIDDLEVAHPEWQASDEDVQEALDNMRDRFAEVEAVARPAQRGDYVTVTITGKKNGEEVEEASAEDLLYPIPEEDTDSELDAQLLGAEAGAILNFTDVLGPDYPDGLAGQELEFTAIVKEVKHKVLPELDDDFALTASEFDTIEELTEDLREELGREKLQQALANLRGAVVEAVADLVDIPLPESLVEEEHQYRLNRLAHQAQHSGMSLDQFLSIVGGDDPSELVEQMRQEAEKTVKAQLIVDEVGQSINISIERQDLGEEVARQAMRMGRDPNEIAELMLHPDRIGALYADAYRRKAIDHLLSVVTITGAPPEELVEALQRGPEDEDAEDTDTDAEVQDTDAEVQDTDAEVQDTDADAEAAGDEEE